MEGETPLILIEVRQDGTEGAKRKVFFHTDDCILAVGSSRVSPLLPVDMTPSSCVLPDNGATCRILFVFSNNPNNLLYELQRLELYLEHQSSIRLFATIGRANVVIYCAQPSLCENVKDLLHSTFKEWHYGFEEWDIEAGSLQATYQHSLKPLYKQACEPLNLDGIPMDARDLAIDANLTIATILSHAKVYAPEIVPQVTHIQDRLHAILDEIRSTTTETIDTGGRAALAELSEIVATLSYVDSQWFSGISKILAHPAQMRDHSLLGIGTACSGLSNTLRKAIGILQHTSYLTRFSEQLKAPFFKVTPDRDGQYQVTWREHLNAYTLKLTKLPEDDPYEPPLVHFSTRRGWRQTNSSLSAHTATLKRGTSEVWHLRNVSHEFLHILVKQQFALLYIHNHGLLESLNLQGHDSIPSPYDFELAMQRASFERLIADKAVDAGVSTLAGLIIAARKMLEAEHVIQGNKNESQTYKTGRHVFEEWRPEIEEIAVHILDAKYFYRGDKCEYLRSLWLAWSRVPSIPKRLDFYLRRLMSAIIALDEQPSVDSIYKAKTFITESLTRKPLVDLDLSKETLRHLRSDRWRNETFVRMEERLYLIHLINAFFTDSKLRSGFHQELVYSGPSSPVPLTYTLNGIDNPMPFLRELQLRFPTDCKATSMWAYLQLASTNFDEELSNANLL